jgi:ubiquinol-cytochrome c reductase cytochrome b subunit
VDLGKLIKSLSAEAQLSDQRTLDAKDVADIEEGRKLVKTFGCTDCHAFGTAKGAGAPNLNGYGSRAWIRDVISNPADKRYFGDKNDRMPAYEKQLSPQQIDLVTDWLRGEWYESSGETTHD